MQLGRSNYRCPAICSTRTISGMEPQDALVLTPCRLSKPCRDHGSSWLLTTLISSDPGEQRPKFAPPAPVRPIVSQHPPTTEGGVYGSLVLACAWICFSHQLSPGPCRFILPCVCVCVCTCTAPVMLCDPSRNPSGTGCGSRRHGPSGLVLVLFILISLLTCHVSLYFGFLC